MPLKIKLDGFEVEVADANAQAIIERAVESARKDGEQKASAEKKRADDAAAELVKATADKAALQAKVDSAEAASKKDAETTIKIDGTEVKLVDFVSKVDETLRPIILRKATERAALVVEARKHLSTNEKLDGLSDAEIKKLVIKKLDKDVKLDDKDETYVSHRYQFEVDKASKAVVPPIARVRTALDAETEVSSENEDDGVDPKSKMDAAYDEQYFKNRKSAAK